MSADVFLLGAGFSKAVSAHMPLMNELGQVIPLHLAWDYGLIGQEPDFEKLLTFLSQNQPWLSESDNLRNRATFLDVSVRISGALGNFEFKALADAMPDWFEGIVTRWLEQRSWVITLNYDTLIEHAYTELLQRSNPGLGAVLSHSALYAVPIQSALARTRAVLDPFEGAKTLRLIKLHGSLNWRYSGSEMAAGEEIYDIGLVPGWDSAQLDADARSAAMDKVPLVIPPTLGKSIFFTNGTVRSLWRLAFRALRKAEHVYALGYSLPESDDNMVGLLRHALSESKTLHVVNRSPEAGKRYRRLLTPRTRVNTDSANEGVEEFVRRHLGSLSAVP